MIKFVISLIACIVSTSVLAANVRFSNDVSEGLSAASLSPHNGNDIRVYDQLLGNWITCYITMGQVKTNVSGNGYFYTPATGDVANSPAPYDTILFAFLKTTSGCNNLYIVWTRADQVSYVHGPEGFYVDSAIQQGHLVGIAYRKSGNNPIDNLPHEIQGRYNGELLVSYYNRGSYDFFSVPACSVSAGQGWQPCGLPVYLVCWPDDGAQITAVLNFTSNGAGASLQGAIAINGERSSFGAAYNQTINKPYPVLIRQSFGGFNGGYYEFQVHLQTDNGTATLGAVLNSALGVYGKF